MQKEQKSKTCRSPGLRNTSFFFLIFLFVPWVVTGLKFRFDRVDDT